MQFLRCLLGLPGHSVGIRHICHRLHGRVLPHRGEIEGAAVGQPMSRKDFFHRCVDGLGTALAAELTDQLPAGLELGRNVGNQLVLRC